MWKFIANAKRALWEFVELAFLSVLALMVIFLLLGKGAGNYVESVADNVTKFAAGSSSGLLCIVIVLAGPVMNVVFPVVLYSSVFLADRMLLPPTIGVSIPGKPASGKLMAGDRVLAIDGAPVTSFMDVQRAVASKPNVPMHFEVERDGKNVGVDVTPENDTETHELDIVEHVGRIGIVPSFPEPILGIPRVDSPAYRAGLRTFDRVTAINGRPIDRFVDLVDVLAQNKGDTLMIAFLRPVPTQIAGGLADIAVMEPGVATLTPSLGDGTVPQGQDARAKDVFTRTGIEGSDMYVAYVPEESSEWKAGLRAGDRITKLDGQDQVYWQSMEDSLVASAAAKSPSAIAQARTSPVGV